MATRRPRNTGAREPRRGSATSRISTPDLIRGVRALWALPAIRDIRVQRRTLATPRRVRVGPRRREVREVLEVRVRFEGRLPIRAVTPALFIGRVPISDYRLDGNEYVFTAYQPDRLTTGAPIALGWPHSPQTVVASTFRLGQGAAAIV